MSENIYRKYFDVSLDMLCIAGTDGYFKQLNSSFSRVLGFTEEELKARPFIDFVHPDDVQSTLKEVESLAKRELTINFVNRYATKSGDYRYFRWNCFPDPTTGELFASARDITELKKTQKALNDAILQLKASNKELDEFAYIISHDLKAPLRAISTLSSFVEEDLGDDLSPEAAKNMELMRSRIERMQKLINGVLEYSRVGRGDHEKEPTDVGRIVAEVVSLLQVPEGFSVQIQEDLPTLELAPVQIQQVFQNLLSNAIKYHNRADGKIEVGYQSSDEYHTFYVKDDGPGIPEEYQKKVFGIFQTLQSRDEIESTGLGLTITQKLVRENGGDIWIESEPGQGATFFFTIPV